MNRSEARIYFPEGENIDELYEQKLFEWKNFFVNRFPVQKLFQSKLVSISRQQEAYVTLGGQAAEGELELPTIEFDGSLLENFTRYSQQRNLLKAQLFGASFMGQVVQVAEALLQLTRAYARVASWDSEVDAEVRISIEPDPMDLLAALKQAQEAGIDTPEKIARLPADHLVRTEAKRLSLWLKSNENG